MTAAAKKFLSYFIKVSILVLAFVFIYHRINDNKNLRQFEALLYGIRTADAVLVMSLVFLLMLLNWVLESLKWKFLTRHLSRMTAWQATEAVFCGLTWAVFTPNRLGEYGGRVLFLPNRKRILGVFAMAVGSFGQNVITNLLGLAALVWFNYRFLHLDCWLSVFISLAAAAFAAFMLVLYFNIRWIVGLLDRVRFLRNYHRFFDIIGRYQKNELMRIMWFCLARFFVFSFQYYLVIHLLIPAMPVFPMLMMVFILFFIQSALPSLDLLDVGVRSMTASAFFGYLTQQHIAVMAAVSSIWFINLIIPAILGSVSVLKLRFFDRSV